MCRYKYAFYDMDGTIGDTQEGIFKSTEYAFEKLGVAIDNSYESLRRVVGPPLVHAYMEYFGLSEADAEKARDLYRERYSVTGIYEMKLYDGMEKSLKSLKDAGVKLAVVSAKPQEFIDRIVPHFGLDKYIDLNVGVTMHEKDTSKVHLIKRAVEHFGITDMSEVVMVGDRMYDLDGAAELGVDGIGVSYGFGDIEELKNSPNVFIADSPEAVAKFIKG